MPAAYWAALLYLAAGFAFLAFLAFLPHPLDGDDDE